MPTPSKKTKVSSKSFVLSATNEPSLETRPLLVDDISLAIGSLDYQLYKNATERKTHQRMLKGESSRISISATNFGEKPSNSKDFNYLVCVLNEESGTGSVYDAEFLISHRTVKAIEEAREKAVDSLTGSKEASRQSSPVDYKAAKVLLGESFGTRKAKQALNSVTKNQINIEQLESSAASFINRTLDKSIDRIAETAAEEVDGESQSISYDLSSILPPFDSTTSKVEQIYQVSGIISDETMQLLPLGDFSSNSNESWENIKTRYGMSDFILDKIKNLPDTSGKNQKHLACLLFMHFLMNFRLLKEGALNNETALQKAFSYADPSLLNHLLEMFTEPISVGGKIKRKVSALAKDRLVSYLCVLTLLVDQFRVNLTVMSTVLKIPVTKMTDYFKAVGCAIDKPGKGEEITYTAVGTTRALNVKYAVLKAPIAFPKPKRGPQK